MMYERTIFISLLITSNTFVCYARTNAEQSERLPKIAVIGAGIGGASTSYYLRQLFGSKVNIDVYEKERIGGRVANVELSGKEYEAGASIIHDRNMYMVNLTQTLGLQKRDPNPGRLGIFAETQLVFRGSRWGLAMISQLVWRYGWDMYRLRQLINNLLEDFSKIYDHQRAGRCFTTVDRLLTGMSPRFVSFLEQSIADRLRIEGFSEKFINELVTGGIRGNYGQDADIHAFVGAISIAGAGASLWSVKGGNKKVVEKLIEHANVNIILRYVQRVSRNDDKRFHLSLKSRDDSHIETDNTYDIVVIAAPLYSGIAGIDVSDVTEQRFPQKFHGTVATFVQGWPRAELFGVANVNDIPETLLTSGPHAFFNAIGRQTAVDFESNSNSPPASDLPVWKVFSKQPLDDSGADKLFVSRKHTRVHDWLAYPSYAPPYTPVDKLPPFELSKNMYFVNAFEMAASTLETTVVAGRNVALLAHQRWLGRTELIDQFTESHTGKEEL